MVESRKSDQQNMNSTVNSNEGCKRIKIKKRKMTQKKEGIHHTKARLGESFKKNGKVN
jgi:hypothetical protein